VATQKPATQRYDAIVIGTGQAGPPLARRLAAAGMMVAVIERGAFGGTCVNTGCIPTKTLVASAYAAHMARRAADLGVSASVDRINTTEPGPRPRSKANNFYRTSGPLRTSRARTPIICNNQHFFYFDGASERSAKG
jgi:choline dehydrogenase-like flavoprotein